MSRWRCTRRHSAAEAATQGGVVADGGAATGIGFFRLSEGTRFCNTSGCVIDGHSKAALQRLHNVSAHIGTQVVNTWISGLPPLLSPDQLCQSGSGIPHVPARVFATCNHHPPPMAPMPRVPTVAGITFAMMIRNWNTERPLRRRTNLANPGNVSVRSNKSAPTSRPVCDSDVWSGHCQGNHSFGYTVLHDLSRRRVKNTHQWYTETMVLDGAACVAILQDRFGAPLCAASSPFVSCRNDHCRPASTSESCSTTSASCGVAEFPWMRS
jgi:hypothetical protein